jgi:hypothetical protein
MVLTAPAARAVLMVLAQDHPAEVEAALNQVMHRERDRPAT